MQSETLPQRTVVLLGAGHTHAHILRMWAQQPIHDTELICISSSPIATYSGMLPGVLAGQYAPEQMQLDLVRLCNAVGATLLLDEVTGMEVQTRKLYFADRPALHFSALSIGIGSVPAVDSAELSSDRLVKIKPMPTFLDRLRVLIEQCLVERAGRPVRIAVVGGGAGGLEVAFCLPNYVQRVTRQMLLQSKENPWNPDANQATVHHEPCTIAIVHGSGDLPAGFSLKTQDRVRHELTRRGIVVHAGSRVQKVVDTTICLENGTMLEADVIIWATHATPPPLLSKLVLPKDEHGFLRVNDNLQSTSATNVFAVGDSASYASRPLAKCGVYAVRQGPVLWENLQRLIHGKPLQPFQPQKDFLRLLNLGDGRAIGEYANWSFEGRWVWRWKDRIDRRFMEMFDVNHMSRMSMRSTSTAEVDSTAAMRCVGCGGKIGGSLLANVMAELEIPHRDEVVVGLDTPDDAAVLRFTPQKLVTATTDFFTSPVRDHYLAGRITALHALSDAWAMGAEPVAALANVTLPHGSTAGQYRVLLELMSGALRELKNAGATLVGGHTVEGAQVGLGLTILAQQDADRMMLKRDVELGDQLVLTKPLGVGTLLRAAAMSKCHADWWQSLVHSMLTSNGTAASIAFRHGVRAMTDITGFGLAGHLSEMLKSGNCSAKLDLGQIPVLPGAQALWDPPSRLFSTMDLENRRLVLGCIRLNGRATKFATQTPDEWESEIMQLPAVLFDPQTSGGLLIAVPKDRVSALLADLHRHEETAQAARIGEVQPGPWAIDLMGM